MFLLTANGFLFLLIGLFLLVAVGGIPAPPRELIYRLVPLSVYRMMTPDLVAHCEREIEEERQREYDEGVRSWWVSDVKLSNEESLDPYLWSTFAHDCPRGRRHEAFDAYKHYARLLSPDVDERVERLDRELSFAAGLVDEIPERDPEEVMKEIEEKLVGAFSAPESYVIYGHGQPDRTVAFTKEGQLVEEVRPGSNDWFDLTF